MYRTALAWGGPRLKASRSGRDWAVGKPNGTVTKVVGLLTIAMEATHTATTMVMMDTEVRGTPLV